MKSPMIFYEQHPCTSAMAGKAPQLVLLHGWGLHSGVWKNFLPWLSAYFQVTCIDLPGFGKSTGETPRLELSEAMLALLPEKAIWMGWSLGGLLALDIAARYPQRVQALSLLAATPCFVQRPDWLTAMPAEVFSDFKNALQEDAAITLQGFLALQCKGSVSMKADLRFLQSVLQAEELPERQALLAGLHCLGEMDLRAQISHLKIPLQVLLGERDVLVPAALEKPLKVLNPALQVTVIAQAAHLPFVSHPQAIVAALLGFCRHAGLLEKGST